MNRLVKEMESFCADLNTFPDSPPQTSLWRNMKKPHHPHSRESGNPEKTMSYWIPMCMGMRRNPIPAKLEMEEEIRGGSERYLPSGKKLQNHKNNSPKWLIIQLARFGDLMQTVPVIEACKNTSVPPEIHVLTTNELVDLAKTIDGIHKVWGSDRGEWLRALIETDVSLVDRAEMILNLVDPLRHESFDRIINITHTNESAYLATLINAKDTSGLYGTRDRILTVGEWESYFHKILADRSANRFNLVDIHLRIANLEPPRRNGRLIIDDRLKKRFRKMAYAGHNPDLPVLAIQLGAALPLRRWNVEEFAAVADLVSRKTRSRVVLVGTDAEADLARQFQSLTTSNVLNLVGKTSLVELAAILSQCKLLLSGDTGTLHLAAALGVQTVSVFLGMARPEDTAPYGAGHIVFKPTQPCYPCPELTSCNHISCHKDILPEPVAQAIVNELREPGAALPRGTGFKVYRTYFDSEGLQALKTDPGLFKTRENSPSNRMPYISAVNYYPQGSVN